MQADIAIVGAGPAGCAAALCLAGKGLKVALLDKASFPRDKICGDALSADVLNQFTLISGGLSENFAEIEAPMPSHGVRFVAPSGQPLDIPFTNQRRDALAPGYLVSRFNFDHFLFRHVQENTNTRICSGFNVINARQNTQGIELETSNGTFQAALVIAADGAQSAIARHLARQKMERNHHCAGLRQYWQGVQGFQEGNFIELHFYKELLPGYFWIFPMADGKANVGLGMLSSAVSKKQANLKEMLHHIITRYPPVASRFAHAKPLEAPKGWGLPIGSKRRKLSGNHYLLTGDAAGLIDPFTGEGIGNALRSGRVAADTALAAFKKNDFSGESLHAYDREIYRRMGSELKVSRGLQMLLNYPRLFNYIVKKGNNNQSVRTLLTSMLSESDLKAELLKPQFYFRLLFS